MPLVSIITTTYRHQAFIRETIESVLTQTYTDWELLIGDDSPDESTWNIVQEYVAKYPGKIQAWHHMPNKGIVDNMNFLLEKMSGESVYVSFLEWDDKYTPDNLEKKMEIFKKYPEVKLVYSDFATIDWKWNVLKWAYKRNSTGIKNYELIDMIENGNIIQSFGVMCMQKNLLRQVLPFQNLDPSSKMFGPLDYFVWVQLVPQNPIYWIDSSIFQYRIHGSNYSGNVKTMNEQANMIYDFLLKNSKLDKNTKKYTDFYTECHKMMIWFFTENKNIARMSCIKSFQFNQTKFLLQRIGIFILSFLPIKFGMFLYQKYKSYKGLP
jgi:glycosyltransferase involved in cell wall biosynthesis